MIVPISSSSAIYEGSTCTTSLLTVPLHVLIYFRLSGEHVIVHHCGFFQISLITVRWIYFHLFIENLCFLLGEGPIHSFILLFCGIVSLFLIFVVWEELLLYPTYWSTNKTIKERNGKFDYVKIRSCYLLRD